MKNFLRTAGGLLVPRSSATPPAGALRDALRTGTKTKVKKDPVPDSNAAPEFFAKHVRVSPKDKAQRPRRRDFAEGNSKGWTPRPGTAWNPLRRFPRNNLCFCGSKKKAKACCLRKIAWAVSLETAKRVEAVWQDLLAGVPLKDAITAHVNKTAPAKVGDST
jgi:hypothetical protein